jgi:hypothetical protein
MNKSNSLLSIPAGNKNKLVYVLSELINGLSDVLKKAESSSIRDGDVLGIDDKVIL